LTFNSSSPNLFIPEIYKYISGSADLISACGRIKNTAKVKEPALAKVGFFVPALSY
jgi:hypothetical protein